MLRLPRLQRLGRFQRTRDAHKGIRRAAHLAIPRKLHCKMAPRLQQCSGMLGVRIS
jgi:hypothetical protein